jgi:hypothetical protein
VDDCGVCDGGNADKDCAGVCGGDAQVLSYWSDFDGDGYGAGAPFGFCSADVADGWVSNNSDLEPDCASNDTDDCGVCAGGNVDKDCASVCFGVSQLDDCDVCNGGNLDKDCAGVCFGGAIVRDFYFDSDSDGKGAGDSSQFCDGLISDSWVDNDFDLEPDCATNDTDDCDVCAGDNSSCADCAGVPYGNAYRDMCEVCDNNSGNDCVQDCFGAWGGDAVEDDCGICGGDNSSCNRPIVSDQSVLVYEDSFITFSLNASDPNDDNLSVNVNVDALHGDVTFNGLDATYTPDPDFNGTDSFIYTVTDGHTPSVTV